MQILQGKPTETERNTVQPVEKLTRNPEMDRFRSALKSVMQVSKEDLKEILTKEKAANADKPRRGPKTKTSPSK
jgi:hypothetical protein